MAISGENDILEYPRWNFGLRDSSSKHHLKILQYRNCLTIGDSDLDRESPILAAIGEKREKMLRERREK